MAGRFNTLPTWFLQSRAGQAIVAEEAARVIAERKELVEKRAALRAELERGLPRLRANVDAAKKRAAELTVERHRAFVTLMQEEAERDRFASSLEHQISAIDAELRRDADPAITEFQTQLQDEVERLRRSVIDTVEVGEPNLLGWRKRVSTRSSRDGRLEALTKAVREAEALKTDPGEGIEERLRSIYEALPAVQGVGELIPEGERS